MGKKEWRESSNGPDCLDVAMIMNAVATLHGCHVGLVVTPDGTASGSPVDIALSALFECVPGSDLPMSVAVHHEWPNSYGTSFWGEAYSLIWKLDEEIGRAYKQKSLMET